MPKKNLKRSADDSSPAAPPRKRGRPKRNVGKTEGDKVATSLAGPPRKRGRPPKKKRQKDVEKTIAPVQETVDEAMKDADPVEGDKLVPQQINGKPENADDSNGSSARPSDATNREQPENVQAPPSKDHEEELVGRKETSKERENAVEDEKSNVENGDATQVEESTKNAEPAVESGHPATSSSQLLQNGLEVNEEKALGEVKADESEVKEAVREEPEEKPATIVDDSSSIVDDAKREPAVLSTVEKATDPEEVHSGLQTSLNGDGEK